MKKKITPFAAALIFMFVSFTTFSQSTDKSVPSWVSEKGYWVVEGNKHQPLQHTVRFYNNEHLLIGSQAITSRLNVKRKRVKMQLKSMLESSLVAWAANQAVKDSSAVAAKP